MKRQAPGIAAGYGSVACAAHATRPEPTNRAGIAHVRTQQSARSALGRVRLYTSTARVYDPRP